MTHSNPLFKIIKSGFDKMINRKLFNSPKKDEVDDCAYVMARDLYESGYRDKDIPRIVDALDFFGANSERWPTPIGIKETLKARQSLFVKEVHKLPEPEYVQRRRKENGIKSVKSIRKIMGESDKDMLKKVNKKIKTINEEDHNRLIKEDSWEGIVYRDMMGLDVVIKANKED